MRIEERRRVAAMKQSILAAAALSISALLHPITAHADNSSVKVASESGRMQCAIQTNDAANRGNHVGCDGYTPALEGNLAVMTANGVFYRRTGNLV
jgi:spermidine/putrescine-binding protein